MAFVKLQEENLSNPRPGLVYKIFRATHPSIGERIDFCNSYHPGASAPDREPRPVILELASLGGLRVADSCRDSIQTVATATASAASDT